MKYSVVQLVAEFIDEVREDYPGMDREHLKEIIDYAWKELKSTMEDGELRNFRMHYLGMFRVYRKRVEVERKMLDSRYERGLISERDYLRISRMLDKYLEDENKGEKSKVE